MSLSRRQWLQSAGLISLAGSNAWSFDKPAKPLPVAAVLTTYHENSHADVLVGKVLEGYKQKGGPGPNLELVSLWSDQVHPRDLSRPLAKKHGFRICKSIDEALTLGTDELKVAGVLCIGEHGDYPSTKDTKQKMYPRRRLFDGITATFRRVGKVAPVFNDKHLSYNWRDAKHMYDSARELKVPFMAGSSLPVTWREPAIKLPMGCEIESAMAIGYGGNESYGFHAMETLQCMIERRKGGESGVVSVEAAQADAARKAERDGRWSRELLDAALKTMPDVRDGTLEKKFDKFAFYLLEHRDGLRSSVVMANGVARHFAFAAKIRGQDEPVATWFRLQDEKPYGHFEHLLKAIDNMFQTGKPSYPVERTLLTTGVLDRAMHSLAQDGKKFETPELDVRYTPTDWGFANYKIGK